MKNKIYLAGGLRSDWQKKVIEAFDDEFIFFNPREHGLENNSREYTTWDLHFLGQSDILFGYMETDNPSGYGLALEVGFAKAQGKTIILVDEKSPKDSSFDRYYKMVHDTSNVVFYTLDQGIEYLKSFARSSHSTLAL
ncbi:nucleoside 2-deoxyribosyltransferase domain-containing protein [Lewinella sp. LCG006]|uniref:nucleoside 2-deoxyribosyltransferase domain-containing protein n=1 Tax=Lewinella sp. LCG006 TaxID=3231911 RepID=UPI0034604E3D